ncbi:site-specific integrase [Shewanella gelidimarina]|uniref:tyrosine-type recombinase/integrase n=1 Tax=Shewanella gelidimarina TaxID=56813 RepID=UPI00200BA15C|nr:tyrosine-type recombinase/integrase [Shewanella gelidimarina]MCL1058661.1 site-specific integrase [Shewanella gelidimarina]
MKADLKEASGVTAHNGSLRVQFKLPELNNAIKRSLSIPITKANIKLAKLTLANIKQDIANGLYKNAPEAFWLKHFPTNSINSAINITVESCIDEYTAESANILTDSTRDKLTTIKSWLERSNLLDKPIAEITVHVFNKLRVRTLETCTYSTVIDYTSSFNKILKHALDKKYIKSNPTLLLKKLVKDDIHLDDEDKSILPFSQNELSRLIAVIHIPQTKRMAELLAWTGLRPGELKSLAWEDVDLENLKIHVKYNITRQGNLKPPKTTAGHRVIELLPRALEVLLQQKEETFSVPSRRETIYYKNQKTKVVERKRVFLGRNNEPYKGPELTSTTNYWKNWLIEAGLTHRPAYQLRHTYASQLLMAGAEPLWLAKQMGHSDWGMIRKIYGQWVSNEKPDYVKEMAIKLNQSYE